MLMPSVTRLRPRRLVRHGSPGGGETAQATAMGAQTMAETRRDAAVAAEAVAQQAAMEKCLPLPKPRLKWNADEARGSTRPRCPDYG